MVERQLCKLDVRGSSPLTSTLPSFITRKGSYPKNGQIDIRVAKLQKSAAEMLQLQQFCGKITQFPRIETHKNQAYKAKIRDNFQIKVNHRGMTSCE